MAIPDMSFINRLKAAVMALALLILAELIDYPFNITGGMDRHHHLINVSLSQKALLFWEYFLDKGGRNFMALLISLISILPFHHFLQTKITGKQSA